MNDEDPRHDAFCTECGERLDADAPFCGACGEPVAAADGGPGWTLPKSGMFALGALGFAVVLVGVGLLVPSVGGSSDRVSVEIAGAEGGRVTLGEDIEVVLPAGALSGDAVLSVLRGASERLPEGQLPGARPVGDAFEITVEGATLTGTAILTFGLDRQLADDLDAVFVTYFDEDSEEWRPVAAVVDAASGMVRAEVEHLSLWRPATWDVDAIADGLGESYDRLFGLADPPPPECKPDPADGIEVVYRGVYACVKGGAGEPLVVRITNPRTFAIEIQAPPGTPQATVSASSSLSDELLQRVLERLGPDVVYVLPGATAEFVMEFDPAPGSELRWAVRGSEDAALASAVLFMLETAESMLDSTQLSGFRDCLETVAPQGLTEASFLTTMGGCGPALISNLGEAQGGFVVGLIRGTTQALQGLVERGVGDLLRGYEFTGSAVVTIEATGEEHRSEQHLEMIGGTWNRFDVPELLGTAFMWDPQHGIMDSVHVHGPEGWNERTDDTWTCPLYQPPGISPNRSICFTHASPAIPGLLTATQRYHAQAEVGTKAVEATFGFFVGDQLDHVIDMSVTDVSLTEVAVEWTAPPGSRVLPGPN